MMHAITTIRIVDPTRISVYESVVSRIRSLDLEVREQLAGESISEIRPIIEDDLGRIGVPLTADTVNDYTRAVAEDHNFEFVIG